MHTLEECRELFEEKLKSIHFVHEPEQLYNPIKYILSVGGKRIRPALLLLVHSIYDKLNDDAFESAMAVETFHNFTLIHDDIMDNAVLRRNAETVHKKWDINTGILSGDAMLILAYSFISSTSDKVKYHLIDLFNKTALKVCEGQQYDMNFEKFSHISIDDYLKMVELKTAVLIATSMQMGAITAQANENDWKHIYEFGKNIGIAFQLQDDYLDVYAEEDVFGKKIGNDIITNKKTYLLASVLNTSESKKIAQIKEWMDKKKFDPREKIEVFMQIYHETDIQKKTLNEINRYYENGLEHLGKLNISEDDKKRLKHTIKKLMVIIPYL
jgi:geranylgeranyl diphosphate synthase, type II